MNIHSLEEKLNQCMDDLANDSRLTKIYKNLKDNTNIHPEISFHSKLEYYNSFSYKEKKYHILNDQYHLLISQFSKEYLELTDFYVGDNLPRDTTYLDSQQDIQKLYFLFLMFGFFSSCKFC